MTCNHCCGAEKLFDLKGAKKELKKFNKKGAGKATKKLISHLLKNDLQEKSLLDIGGGIGAIQWTFLRNSGRCTIDVDASLGYLTVAKGYAKEHGYEQSTEFLHGDFVDQYDEVANADYVTLDKVICCYPDYKSLLNHAMRKCNFTLILVYPLGGFIPKAIAQFNKIYFYLKKNPFRTYIHSPKEVEQFICNHGFKLVTKSISFPWHVQTYERIS